MSHDLRKGGLDKSLRCIKPSKSSPYYRHIQSILRNMDLRYPYPDDRIFTHFISDISVVLRETTLTNHEEELSFDYRNLTDSEKFRFMSALRRLTWVDTFRSCCKPPFHRA